jgi:DNA-binding NtrC family response regulator
VRRFTPQALVQLAAYSWPGNVRELRNAVQRAYVMAEGEFIDDHWLPRVSDATAASSLPPAAPGAPAVPLAPVGAAAGASGAASGSASGAALGAPAAPPALAPEPLPAAASVTASEDCVVVPIGSSMVQAEQALLVATLRHFHHHKERTAAVLGISLKTLYNRLKEYAAKGSDTPPPPPPPPPPPRDEQP